MPYITQQRRESFLPLTKLIEQTRIDSAGEINFLVVMLAQTYLAQHGKSYRTMNDIVGAIECAKVEFMRRVLFPHEDEKRVENKDVFGAKGEAE